MKKGRAGPRADGGRGDRGPAVLRPARLRRLAQPQHRGRPRRRAAPGPGARLAGPDRVPCRDRVGRCRPPGHVAGLAHDAHRPARSPGLAGAGPPAPRLPLLRRRAGLHQRLRRGRPRRRVARRLRADPAPRLVRRLAGAGPLHPALRLPPGGGPVGCPAPVVGGERPAAGPGAPVGLPDGGPAPDQRGHLGRDPAGLPLHRERVRGGPAHGLPDPDGGDLRQPALRPGAGLRPGPGPGDPGPERGHRGALRRPTPGPDRGRRRSPSPPGRPRSLAVAVAGRGHRRGHHRPVRPGRGAGLLGRAGAAGRAGGPGAGRRGRRPRRAHREHRGGEHRGRAGGGPAGPAGRLPDDPAPHPDRRGDQRRGRQRVRPPRPRGRPVPGLLDPERPRRRRALPDHPRPGLRLRRALRRPVDAGRPGRRSGASPGGWTTPPARWAPVGPAAS